MSIFEIVQQCGHIVWFFSSHRRQFWPIFDTFPPPNCRRCLWTALNSFDTSASWRMLKWGMMLVIFLTFNSHMYTITYNRWVMEFLTLTQNLTFESQFSKWRNIFFCLQFNREYDMSMFYPLDSWNTKKLKNLKPNM